MSARKTALVACPGRGTYNKTEYGYLRRYGDSQAAFLAMADAYRRAQKQTTVTDLDSTIDFSLATHSRGDNASPLIYACSLCDFSAIDPSAIEVVAVTGNSMGWYTALACGGAVDPEQALWIVNTMGAYMQEALIGGQIVYSTVDDDWQPIPGRRTVLLNAVAAINRARGLELFISIELGGMIVFAGTEAALDDLIKQAPTGLGRFPLRLHNHAAFHSPLQKPISERAKSTLSAEWFRGPSLPMIDGRGHIWRPHSTDTQTLWDYTFGAQVIETYDFTKAVQVGVREFAPDCLIVLGPGDTLGGAVVQSLVGIGWRGLDSKTKFSDIQGSAPLLYAMGRDDQRAAVT